MNSQEYSYALCHSYEYDIWPFHPMILHIR